MMDRNNGFRPVDNSPTTLLRYRLEAEHWVRAINSAQARTGASLSSSLGFIGLILTIFISLFLIAVCLLIKLFVFVLGGKAKQDDDKFDRYKYPHTPQYLDEPDKEFREKW
jgi:hypothetical protein